MRLAKIIEQTLYKDELDQQGVRPCEICGCATYPPGYFCEICGVSRL